MAKHTALARRSGPIIVALPVPRRSGRLRRAGTRVVRVARRAGRHAKGHLPMMGVAIGGIVAGYAQGKGFLDRLPQIGGSKVLTLGLAGWAAMRYSKTPAIRTAGLAALAAAAFDFGRVQAGGTSGFEGAYGDAGAGPGGGAGY